MTIKEAEEKTGLTRSNIRFYEKEKLIIPLRISSNGYRDYTEKNIEDIRKVAYLRTLGIPIEVIRSILEEKITLYEAVLNQHEVLKSQIIDLTQSKAMCEKMLDNESISYRTLEVDQYISGLQNYWNDNKQVFTLDSVSFLHIWGGFIIWAVITSLSLLIGTILYPKLPGEIPVQWRNGEAISLVNKAFIFAYPIACVIIRYLLRFCIYAKFLVTLPYGELLTEYFSNYLCFIALSVEVFSVLFIYGIVTSITAILFINTAVLFVLLITGIAKMRSKGTG